MFDLLSHSLSHGDAANIMDLITLHNINPFLFKLYNQPASLYDSTAQDQQIKNIFKKMNVENPTKSRNIV